MNKNRLLLILVMLLFVSLACQAFSGGGRSPANDSGSNDVNSPSTSDEGGGKKTNSDSDFPMTADAYGVIDIGDGSVLYYTKLSLEDVMQFYRDEYTSLGYTENELLTVVSDGVFSMAFEGDPSGKSVVIQSVDLGDGSRTVTIRLEDV